MYRVTEGAFGALVVEDGQTRIYIVKEDSVRDQMDAAALARIASAMATPTFYMVDFTDIAFCRDVLVALAEDPDIFVDNDHGLFLSGSDFVRVLRSQPSWDWRRDAMSPSPGNS
jgi:hypothetical protein